MHQEWQEFLAQYDAKIKEGVVEGFGETIEASVNTDQTWLCDLSYFGLIHFIGEDTATFLHGQLSSDIKKLGTDQSIYSCQSTPKGRVLASFRLWQQAGGYMLQLPQTLQAATQKRLSMYILRAKSKASALPNELVSFGIVGKDALRLASDYAGVTLTPSQVVETPEATWLAISATQVMVVSPIGNAKQQWTDLANSCQLTGISQWLLAEIQQGTPWVTEANQDEFVAQMLNLDKLPGGISFTKGCYTGQEIIARTQYLGKLKRRTYRISANAPMQAGDQLYSAEMNGQASGRVVNAVKAGEQWEGLAVIQSSSLANALHLGALNGPVITLGELPYSLEPAEA